MQHSQPYDLPRNSSFPKPVAVAMVIWLQTHKQNTEASHCASQWVSELCAGKREPDTLPASSAWGGQIVLILVICSQQKPSDIQSRMSQLVKGLDCKLCRLALCQLTQAGVVRERGSLNWESMPTRSAGGQAWRAFSGMMTNVAGGLPHHGQCHPWSAGPGWYKIADRAS